MCPKYLHSNCPTLSNPFPNILQTSTQQLFIIKTSVIVSRLKSLRRVNVGSALGPLRCVHDLLYLSHVHFYKVSGGHDTQAVSVIWEMTGSRAGRGVACRHRGVSVGAREAECFSQYLQGHGGAFGIFLKVSTTKYWYKYFTFTGNHLIISRTDVFRYIS